MPTIPHLPDFGFVTDALSQQRQAKDVIKEIMEVTDCLPRR